ncbi:uncharacterized protein LOC112351289 [Selaginella moellendorffii]|uniref:uncharacterized protein LOC112351289 n=1 Tax=Selaginella moellendorffii TaxID=88036 RepID=UPI000D1C904B|nr:uncharacterized protein LOC112351289 [Selaginella moellendorffii]|eukprot:XP_024544649.1 uncharacterized protein LOC112351289 [Selaginella moellendorffii]
MVFHTELMIRLARAPKSLSLGRGDTPDTDPDMTWLSTMIQKPQADHGFPSAAISALAPARIAKLRPESLARGRVLHGVLIADALMLEDSVQVLTTLRDSRGDEVLLAIKHAVASDATAEQVRAKYPRGARVAVKEPMLHKHHGSFISLDNPANVEVISYLSDEQLERFAGMAPAALRVEGNKLFQDGSFEAAAQAYALSAVKCEQEEERDRVLALSNQAESFFKLGRYEQCVDAASAALAVDPRHLKSLYRKALALLNLQCYEWSCRLLSDVLGVDEAVDQLHKRCQKLVIQSQDINSIMADIHGFYRAWSEGEQAPLFPEVADNVCQVEVKKCEDQSKQRGRGLFATTNIKKGELVLTSNSAAFERGGNISVCNRNAAIRFLDMAMKSPRAYKQIHSLASMAAGNEREVPAMELFQADWATPENWSSVSTDSSREALEGISVERIFETVRVASFNPTGPGPDENTQRLLYVGTWLIPSFINHCCVGNVCQRLFGTTVCYFATWRHTHEQTSASMSRHV